MVSSGATLSSSSSFLMAQNKLLKLRLPSMNSRLQREGKFDHPGCLYLLPIMESATKYPIGSALTPGVR